MPDHSKVLGWNHPGLSQTGTYWMVRTSRTMRELVFKALCCHPNGISARGAHCYRWDVIMHCNFKIFTKTIIMIMVISNKLLLIYSWLASRAFNSSKTIVKELQLFLDPSCSPVFQVYCFSFRRPWSSRYFHGHVLKDGCLAPLNGPPVLSKYAEDETDL